MRTRDNCFDRVVHSNACKLTPAGGKICVRTKLILPDPASSDLVPSAVISDDDDAITQQNTEPSIAPFSLPVKNTETSNVRERAMPAPKHIVVRIEVEDTGVGIRSEDMIENRLFSPYVRTETMGPRGGKGPGLGLAVVKHIVELSGGRFVSGQKVDCKGVSNSL